MKALIKEKEMSLHQEAQISLLIGYCTTSDNTIKMLNPAMQLLKPAQQNTSKIPKDTNLKFQEEKTEVDKTQNIKK